jgi:hypothetical protein
MGSMAEKVEKIEKAEKKSVFVGGNGQAATGTHSSTCMIFNCTMICSPRSPRA